VAAIKHDVLQDIPVALVELKTDQRNISDNDLLFYVKDKLGNYALWRLFIVSKIPRNEQGKLQKVEVMKLIELKLSGS
jgi:acyl-coenzyme A synthetase/AMP-(fatty) acid ligase